MLIIKSLERPFMPPYWLPRQRFLSERVAVTVSEARIPIICPSCMFYLFISSGLVHDGASVPRVAQSFINAWGPAERGSIPHDALYRTRGGRDNSDTATVKIDRFVDGVRTPCYFSRLASDQVLKAGFANHFSRFKIKFAYISVRLFGSRHWGGPCPSLKKG